MTKLGMAWATAFINVSFPAWDKQLSQMLEKTGGDKDFAVAVAQIW
jgi:hypothetical protein